MMGVGFLRENGELQTWAAREWATCGSVPYFVIGRRAGENGVQTIVPPERAYVGDRP
jgi:hypothetical protein